LRFLEYVNPKLYKMRKLQLLTLLMFFTLTFKAQYDENIITTAVPFLTITPDARAGAMGDIGAATSADLTSIFYNAAKYSFIDKQSGFQISYSPWLHKIATDMSINYLSGYFKINDQQAFAASLKYFAIGEIQFTDQYGNNTIAYKPNEFALTGAYALRLTEHFAGAVSLRFILSSLTGGASSGNVSHAGIAFAGDLAFAYNRPITLKGQDANISWGINLSNIGSKISYSSELRAFIPTNFKTGVGFKYYFDEFNSLELGIDINKLMVPSPPLYDENGNVIMGTEPDVSPTEGIIRSWGDALNGFSEEIHETMLGTGLEYGYNDLFFVRGGMFYESPKKGGRRFFSTGVGFKYNVLNLDFSYLVPIYSHSPLEATMRFSLSFYFNKNTSTR